MNTTRTWSKSFCFVLVAGGLLASPASADFIMNEFSADGFGDNYSALFTISDTGDPDVFSAKLTNTSPNDGVGDDPLIDLLAFNVASGFDFGVNFDIENVSPNWDVSAGSGGVQFDVLLEAASPFDRLGIGDMLTFDIVFPDGTAPGFGTFLDAEVDAGTGIGGGNDFGQKAVSFQGLGADTEGSDLVADNWDPPVVIRETAEPSTLVLLGTGLMGIATVVRRRRRN